MDEVGRTVVRWRDAGGQGLEHLVLQWVQGEIEARSVILCGDGQRAFTWSATIDLNWHTRRLIVEEVGGDNRLELTSNGTGSWMRGSAAFAELEGAIDIDLSASPFTNTLPIRRLDLEIGRAAEIVTAYVAFPELTVQPDTQRYTRLGPRSWRFEAVDEDFEREITVDEMGLVVSYPGLFERVVP